MDKRTEEKIKEFSENIYTLGYMEGVSRALNVLKKTEKGGEWKTSVGVQGGIMEVWYTCSDCGYSNALLIPRNYCPKCGARMVEPQESEDKE